MKKLLSKIRRNWKKKSKNLSIKFLFNTYLLRRLLTFRLNYSNTEKNNCDSSDSGDIFRPIKKIRSTWKKRRMGSSSETEADLKNSNSDSVKVISDDSDKPKKK